MVSVKQQLLIAFGAMTFLVATSVSAEDSRADIMKADANNDGKVSFEEYKAAHEEKLKARFKRKDVNNDGFVDLEEKKIAKQKRKQKELAEKEALRQSIREELSEERKTRKRHFYKYK